MKTSSVQKNHPLALHSISDVSSLREKLATEPYKSLYLKKKALSDSYHIEVLEDMAHKIKPWRTFNHTFTVPKGAAKLNFGLNLSGKGSVWLDNVKLTHSSIGLPVPVENGNFEQGDIWPDLWIESTGSENSKVYWNKDRHSNGEASVKLISNDRFSKCCLSYKNSICVISEEVYTLHVDIRQDEESSDGFSFVLDFKDTAGISINQQLICPKFNRTTQTLWRELNNSILADALVYTLSDDAAYAEKAKKKLIYMLKDILRGMQECKESEAPGWHPDDCYGAVHIGRALITLSLVYDQIANSGVISPYEEDRIRESLYSVVDMLMDTDYYDYTDIGWKESNWNTDRCTGLGIFAIVFNDYYRDPTHNSAEYLKHAKETILWQLENVVGNDGSWPETVRYHSAVLTGLTVFAKALERFEGTNLFLHPKFKSMFTFIINIQTPNDSINTVRKNKPVIPGISDSGYESNIYLHLIHAASEYANEEISKEMLWTWRRAGCPISIDTPMFIYNDERIESIMPVLVSSRFDDIGYVLFRQNINEESEDYCIFNSNQEECIRKDKETKVGCIWDHRHFDQGSFSIWADSTPVILDSSVGKYYNGDMTWFKSSAAHNVIQFRDKNGILSNSPATSTVEDVIFSSDVDSIKITIPERNATSYTRHMAFVKSGFDVYVLWDSIAGSYGSRFNLHTLSSSTEINGSTVVAHCHNNKDLDVHLLLPQDKSIHQSVGGLGGAYPQNYQQHIKIDAPKDSSYLTLLYPRDRAEEGLAVNLLNTDNPFVTAYKIEKSGGKSFVFLCNSSNAALEVNIFCNNETDALIKSVYIDGNSLKVFID